MQREEVKKIFLNTKSLFILLEKNILIEMDLIQTPGLVLFIKQIQ